MPGLLSVQGWLGVGRSSQMVLMERALIWPTLQVGYMVGAVSSYKTPLAKVNRLSEPQFSILVPPSSAEIRSWQRLEVCPGRGVESQAPGSQINGHLDQDRVPFCRMQSYSVPPSCHL